MAYLGALVEKVYINKGSLLNIEGDDCQIDENVNIKETTTMRKGALAFDLEMLGKPKIHYSKEYRQDEEIFIILALRLQSIYSEELSSTPAGEKHFDLQLNDESDWFTNKGNKTTPVNTETARYLEVYPQCDSEQRYATEPSRGMEPDTPNPKADGSWRFLC